MLLLKINVICDSSHDKYVLGTCWMMVGRWISDPHASIWLARFASRSRGEGFLSPSLSLPLSLPPPVSLTPWVVPPSVDIFLKYSCLFLLLFFFFRSLNIPELSKTIYCLNIVRSPPCNTPYTWVLCVFILSVLHPYHHLGKIPTPFRPTPLPHLQNSRVPSLRCGWGMLCSNLEVIVSGLEP